MACGDLTLDNAADKQASDYVFGLWINEGTGLFDQLLDEYAYQTLTVSVWYEDGRESKMTVELSPVDLKAKMVFGERLDGSAKIRELLCWIKEQL